MKRRHADARSTREGSAKTAKKRGYNRQIRVAAAGKDKADALGLVVGVGASAGGLEAFKSFFAHMPTDSGMAFILIQHLAPDHGSILTELIGHSTAMPVMEARTGTAVVPNSIYVIPPNATLTIAQGRLRVTKPAPPRESRHPIDTFMYSLAEDVAENAACVILSGSGSDGAQGLAAIKEHGGITLAQAQFDETAMSGMPSSAAATGLVDHVLPVDAMAAKLIQYQQHLADVRARKGSDGIREEAQRHLDEVCALLDQGVGHDFSQYKEGTLVRRIQRRMQVRNFDEVAEYVAYLRKEPHEVELLFRDLLIGVTHFFRDPEAFDALARITIPELVRSRRAAGPVRLWVAGCATGEEVYSIAILLREAAASVPTPPKFVIFGTDINDTAIAIARAGRYHKSRLDGLSAERVQRWFVEDGEYYCPSVEIREMCVFSVHSIIKDPPFSKLHLVSCRNVLIYMDGSAQDRVIRLLHYALRPGGHLFLGSSESVTKYGEFFTILDKKHRLFQRNDAAAASLPSFAFSDSVASEGGAASTESNPSPADSLSERGARRVMERYSPAYLVVDRQHQILRFSGQIGKYLEPSEGTASLHLFSLIQSALRLPIREALREASGTQRSVTRSGVPIEVDRKSQAVNLIVEPIPQAAGAARHYVVAFQDPAVSGEVSGDGPIDGAHAGVREIDNELRATKARLQAAIDEAERANEELRSANEEYRSANEEIQSSNEELESSKEELQSLNEELQTLNSELSRRNETLIEANSDLQNFLDSSRIAMLFLDRELRVRKFTPPATDIFHLRDIDRGRPIMEIASRLGYQSLEQDAKESLATLSTLEREVYVPQGATAFIMRIRPYKTVTGIADGVVITLVDITERKRHEEAQARLAAIIDSSRDAVIGHTLDGVINSWNAGAEQMFGYTAKEAIGRSSSFLAPENVPDEVPELLNKLARGQRIDHYETTRVNKDGKELHVSLAISPIRDANGKIIGASKVVRDVSDRWQVEKHRELLMAELDHRVKNTLASVQSIAMQTAQHAISIEEFREAFDRRLLSMAQTHALLTLSHWTSASLREILAAELSPYGPRQITIAGDDAALPPKQALALALGFHELATNAAKYGALSVPEGRVSVASTLTPSDGGSMLEIRWTESEGPPVKKPRNRGFGSRLIERGLRSELDADAELAFDDTGVRCILRFRVDEEGARS